MKIIVISDTHSYHRKIKIPDGDVLIHCGDITGGGELSIINDFSKWISSLPHKNKIVIFGNHELKCDIAGAHRNKAIELIKSSGATYLENSSTIIDGVKFYASPITPFFMNWSFNVNRGPNIRKYWDAIDQDTNVLVTHGPPFGILDNAPRGFGEFEHVGCQDLLDRIWELKNLKAHLFGHIHFDGSKIEEIAGVKFCNAAICTEQYKPTNQPIVIDI